MNREFKTGDIVQHFKRQWVEDKTDPKYTYLIIGVARHTETGQKLMIYKPLYGEGNLFARPLEMFMSEVDREKYPDALQKYRFESME